MCVHLFKNACYVTEPNLGPFARRSAVPVGVVVKESMAFIARPSKEITQLMRKRPEFPNGFHRRAFKDRVRERVTGCMISLCTIL